MSDRIWITALLLLASCWAVSEYRWRCIDAKWADIADRSDGVIERWQALAHRNDDHLAELERKQKSRDWFWSGEDDYNPDGIETFEVRR